MIKKWVRILLRKDGLYLTMRRVLPAPEIPKGISPDSIWHSGEGAGSWYSVKRKSDKIYSVFRYSEKGEVECCGFLSSDCRIEDYWPKAIEILHPSNCKILSLMIDKKEFQFNISKFQE